MKWTSEKPTQPGWYWCRYMLPAGWDQPEIAKIMDGEVSLFIDMAGRIGAEPLEEFMCGLEHQWSGPIPEPEEEPL